MNDAEELSKLADLHARGVLSDEEFAKAKARLLAGHAAPSYGSAPGPNVGAVNGLRRARLDRWIGGVCGGVARYAGIDANLVRLLVVLGTVLGFGSLLVVYLVAWLLMPEA